MNDTPPGVLFTADDFGARRDINAAIQDCLRRPACAVSLVMG
jgi:hypothetical protein